MKMNNTHQLDYPASKLHLLWVTDGSNDKTNELLSAYPEVEVMATPQTGIQLNMEAWTEGRMMLTEEQMTNLRLQVDAFLECIG